MARSYHLNQMRLHWENFLIAEVQDEAGQTQIAGMGQLRPHRHHVLELASLAVVESMRGQGVGGRLIHALLAQAQGPVYLMCRGTMAPYYTRFGFVELTRPAEMPAPFRHLSRLAGWLLPVYHRFVREKHTLSIMAHPGLRPGLRPPP
jgi:N-acetylglutamate synthase-like GNAT family acetyltransferase